MLRSCALLLGILALAGPGCGRRAKPVSSFPGAGRMMAAGTAAAVVTPRVEPADETKLPDDLLVVGVVVNGQARAYSVAALAPLSGHVVNDLIGDVPVSVTYCSLFDCLRVYTHEQRGEPIPLMHVGRTGQGLVLRYQNRVYVQVPGSLPGGEGEEPPLGKVEFEKMTWKAWREKHPRTQVYVGGATRPLAPVPNNA